MGFEIERKWLVEKLPDWLTDEKKREALPHTCIEQGYLCREPVVRVRRDGDACYLTYKGKGLEVREEYNLPLTEAAYRHLLPKCDGCLIEKVRYRLSLTDAVKERGAEGAHACIKLTLPDLQAYQEAMQTVRVQDSQTCHAEADIKTDAAAAKADAQAGTAVSKVQKQQASEALIAELDFFHGKYEGLIYVEVEFPTKEAAEAFIAPAWFGREVTKDPRYSNAALSMRNEFAKL